MSIIQTLWHWGVMVPTANILYIFLYLTKSVPLSIVVIIGVIRIFTLPTTINQIKQLKLNKKLQDDIKAEKDKSLKKKLKRKLKQHNKKSFWKNIVGLILILPFMIAIYRLVIQLQKDGLEALAPYLISYAKDLTISTVSFTLFGINLTQPPNTLLSVLLGISVALNSLVTIALFNQNQQMANMFTNLQEQLKLPGASKEDYKMLANVMNFSKYFNVIANAVLISVVLARFPAIFGFYTTIHNLYNVAITLLLWLLV